MLQTKSVPNSRDIMMNGFHGAFTRRLAYLVHWERRSFPVFGVRGGCAEESSMPFFCSGVSEISSASLYSSSRSSP